MRALRWVRGRLLSLARMLGRINTAVLLTISFFLLLLPLSLIRRLIHQERPPNGWLPRAPLAKDHFHRQY